ncbi:hemolysin family protein [Chachezhania antarctica]|uniref:hemolysin family protein n=1 Tax=Chachezhania antarctica TaxID=2340860 RepID=UPI000EAC2EF3|nr:hemolysin family protein [Chachezhania antarctica]|tara:strand:+ start:5433 stop:6413 length:981 start_codon:yes stop_codon:yes gene_type:complete
MGDNDGSSAAAQSAQARSLTGPITRKTPAEAVRSQAIATYPMSSTTQLSLSSAPSPSRVGLWQRLLDKMRKDEPARLHTNGTHVTEAPRHGMINLRRMRVEDVAVPTAEIVALPVTASRDELLEAFRESGYSRIPVYDNTLDSPQGFAHLKDFALTHGFNGNSSNFDLPSMLRPLLFVPPSMPIGVLLQKMQTERRHMALVIDEYGGVEGLVTIEDLIEQVIGEIEDEHDTDESQTWRKEKAGVYVALAKTPLEEFEAEIGRSLTDHEDVAEEEIDTLGGLVFMLSGRVPTRGEVIPHPDGPEFEVIDADPRRIKRLRVRLKDATA